MQNSLHASQVTKEEIMKLPATTGIYLFKIGRELLYIGKSVNLRSRLLSHLENAKIDAKEAAIINSSKTIECIITDSEFKALLLESQLIQKYKPKYNARWRDDKSPLYIKITTSDNYPKIQSSRKDFDKKSRYFGPFPSVRSVYEILHEIRKVFPYCSQNKISKKPCFHSKIHLCNPCPNSIGLQDERLKRKLKKEYRKNIRSIIKVLEGKTEPILDTLYKQLDELAKKEQFEEAILVRNRILHFENLLHRKMFSPDSIPNYNTAKESVLSLVQLLSKYIPSLPYLKRIECVDVSNFAQKEATASLVVSIDGLIMKKEYRRFRIKDLNAKSDFEMMREVLSRRFKQEWPKPDLLVVDGGKPQVRTAIAVLNELSLQTPLIGIAKNPDRLVVGIRDLPMLRPSIHHLGFNLIRSLRDESHRFAKKYHVLLRSKRLLN